MRKTVSQIDFLVPGDQQIVVDLVISGEPASKGRARYAKRTNKFYTPHQTKSAEEAIGWLIKQAQPGIQPNKRDAFAVEVQFFCKTYHRRDLDNMTKLVMDACNKLVWYDDAQVERLTAEVIRASEVPETRLRVYTFPSSIPYRECVICEKPIRLHPSRKKRQYCSRKCSSAAQQRRHLIPCAHCSTPNEYIEADLKRKGSRYCNLECKRLATTVELTCFVCESAFRRPRSLVRKTPRCYCSEGCMKAHFRKQRAARAYGVCSECGGPKSKKTYSKCRACVVGTFRNALGAGSRAA